MEWLLAFGPVILGGGGAALLIGAGAFFLGGWPLLFNRNVLLAIAAVVAIAAAASWWESKKLELIHQGRAEGAAIERSKWEAANKLAHEKRQAELSDFVVNFTKREDALRGELRLAEQARDRAQSERKSHVSALADSRCVVPLGFVRDHNRDLQAAIAGAGQGQSAVPDGAADNELASGIPLSRAGVEIGHNYAQLGKCLGRLSASEERRYNECLEWDRKWGTESGCTRAGAAVAPRGAPGAS